MSKQQNKKIAEKLNVIAPTGFYEPNPLLDIIKQASVNNIQKTANSGYVMTDVSSADASFAPVVKTPLLYIDPMFDPILFLFPKDRLDEINKRLRHYYETNPIVGSAIDLHTSMPITDFYLECENKEYQKYWNDWKDRVGLLETLRQAVLDYWLLGESILLPVWDLYNYEISHFNQYPPENIDIIQTYVTPKKYFLLKPDPRIAQKLQSASEFDKRITSMMDPDFVEAIKHNRPYFIGDSDKVIYLARTSTKYRSRGISILSRCLKDLLYIDKLRILQLTWVDRHLWPIKVFKLGSEQHGWIPDESHFRKLQDLLARNASDPSFNIIWHFGLNIDYIGTKDKIANLIPEFEFAYKNIMAGLFISEDLLYGGVSPTVRDNVAVRVLMQRYNDIREKIERVLITHVFLPIARIRKMYRGNCGDYHKRLEKNAFNFAKKIGYKNKVIPFEIYLEANRGQLDISAFDIPRPIWKRINIFNSTTEQQNLINMEKEGKFPLSMILEMFGFDPKVVEKRLKEEESTIFDNVYREVRREYLRQDKIKSQVLTGKKIEDIIKDEIDKISKPSTPTTGPSAPGVGIGMPLGEELPPIPPMEFPTPEAPTLPPIGEKLGPLPGGPGGEMPPVE